MTTNHRLNPVNMDISDIDKKPGEDTAADGVERDRPPRGGGSALALLALLFALVALAGSGWVWWQDRVLAGQERQDLADRLAGEIAHLDGSDRDLSAGLSELRAELAALAAADGGAALAELRGRAATDRERLDSLEQSLREQTALARSLQAATDTLHTRLLAAEAGVTQLAARELDAAGELDLAEVDYLLRLASERLQLFADAASAERALDMADRHLAALDDPAHLVVRQAIAAARRELAAVAVPDYVQLATRLDEIQDGIARWPLAGDTGGDSAAGGSEGGADSGWWARLKGTLASLVTVRRSAGSEPVLSLEDKDYVRQQVWLQLESAQLSLMRRDQQAYAAALARAQDSLATWFDPADAAVQSAGRALTDLAGAAIGADLPDITEPWNTLRVVRRAGSPAELSPVPAPVSEPEPESEPASEPASESEPASVEEGAGR